jgi:hypothetical protein
MERPRMMRATMLSQIVLYMMYIQGDSKVVGRVAYNLKKINNKKTMSVCYGHMY